jgi:hypothetical protein
MDGLIRELEGKSSGRRDYASTVRRLGLTSDVFLLCKVKAVRLGQFMSTK